MKTGPARPRRALAPSSSRNHIFPLSRSASLPTSFPCLHPPLPFPLRTLSKSVNPFPAAMFASQQSPFHPHHLPHVSGSSSSPIPLALDSSSPFYSAAPSPSSMSSTSSSSSGQGNRNRALVACDYCRHRYVTSPFRGRSPRPRFGSQADLPLSLSSSSDSSAVKSSATPTPPV